MTEETSTLTGQGTPPVRDRPALDLDGTEFDPVLAALMREGPLTRVRLPHGEGWAWLAARYDDVELITNDPRFGRAEVTRRQVTRPPPHFKPRPGSLAFADQPDHNRLRKAVAAAFTVSATKRLRPRAQAILDDLLAGVVRDGPPADLVERVLEPFPIAVVSEVMGVRAADRERVHAWTRQISTSGGAEAAERAKQGLYAWITDTVRARAGSTGDDVYALLGAAVARGELAEAEAVGLAGPLQIGGEAVTHNRGQMPYLLLTRPELMARMRERPDDRGAVLDELLRHVPHRSSVGLARIALEDVHLHGVRMPRASPCTSPAWPPTATRTCSGPGPHRPRPRPQLASGVRQRAALLHRRRARPHADPAARRHAAGPAAGAAARRAARTGALAAQDDDPRPAQPAVRLVTALLGPTATRRRPFRVTAVLRPAATP
jgi:biflaviolin synthase